MTTKEYTISEGVISTDITPINITPIIQEDISAASELASYVDNGPVPFSQPSAFERKVVDLLRRGEYQAGGEIGRGSEGYVCRLDLRSLSREDSKEDSRENDRKDDTENMTPKLAVKVVSTRYHLENEIDALCRQAEVVRKLDIPGVQRYVAFEIKDVPQDFGIIDRQYRLFSLYEGVASMAEKQGTEIDGRDTEAKAYALLEKVLDVAGKIHARGIIHRDIKPSNIRLDKEGNPILVDFGLARDLMARTLTTSFGAGLIGSYQYLAPEVLFKGQKAGKAGDLYSIGATFVEYLSKEPFAGERRPETMHQRLAQLNLKKQPVLKLALETLLTDEPQEREKRCVLHDEKYNILAAPRALAAVTPYFPAAEKTFVKEKTTADNQNEKTCRLIKSVKKALLPILTLTVIGGGITTLGIYMSHNGEYVRKNKKLWDEIVQTASGEDSFLSNDEKKQFLLSLRKEGYLNLSQEWDWSQELSGMPHRERVDISLGTRSLGSISSENLEKFAAQQKSAKEK